MKSTVRILSLLFALILFTAPLAHAETFDLSGMSYEELVALKDKINLAIWNSQEWQEVTVPQGLWQVGVDIPAGTWAVKCADIGRSTSGMERCYILWGEQLTSDGKKINYDGNWGYVNLYNPNHEEYRKGKPTEFILTFKDGEYIYITPDYNKAVFTPYAGKPDPVFN